MNTREIRNLSRSLALTQEQRDIIVGLVLGDGHLETPNKGKTYRLRVEHAISQSGYVDWLYRQFRNWVRTGPSIKKQVVRGKEYRKYYFSTLSAPALQYFGQLFYPQGKKIVPKNISQLVSPLSLAIWFMDDGSCKSAFHRARIINTQGFSDRDLKYLQEMFTNKFGLSTILRTQKEGKQIYIPSTEVDKFVDLIKPFIIPSMFYKIKFNIIA